MIPGPGAGFLRRRGRPREYTRPVRRSFFFRLSLVSCGLLVSAPFLNPYHYYPLPTFYTEWLAFAVGLVALAAMAIAPSKYPIPIPGICLGFFLLTLLLVLQAALGWVAYPIRSALIALYLIWAALLVVLGAWLKSELGEASVSRALQWWLALGGVLAAASGFLQYYHAGLRPGVGLVLLPVNEMFGALAQRNNFADYLGCALVSVAFLHARNALSLLPALVCALPLAGGMALSGSRGSWAYMGIVFALGLLLRAGGLAQEMKRVLAVAAFALAVFVLIQILNFSTEILAGPLGKTYSSGERLLDERNLGIGGSVRGQLMLYAWLMFGSNPFFGVGFGEFAWRAFELAADLPGPVPSGLDRHSHNLFMQLLAEGGIAGLLCFAIPLGTWLWRTPWRSLSPERCWAIGVLAVIGFHSMVEFPLWHANFLGVFALLLGLASAGSAVVEATRLRRGVITLVAVAGGLTALGALSDYRAAERWYFALEAKSVRGENLGVDGLEQLLRLRESSLFGPYLERIASEAIVLDEAALEDKLALNTQVMRAYPVPSVVLRQVALLALSGRDTEAVRVLRGAARVYPDSVRQWLPVLEELARNRREAFSPLLTFARARPAESGN